MQKVLKGYKQASEATNIPAEILRGMVARRSIRVIRETSKSTPFFYLDDLLADLKALEIPKV